MVAAVVKPQPGQYRDVVAIYIIEYNNHNDNHKIYTCSHSSEVESVELLSLLLLFKLTSVLSCRGTIVCGPHTLSTAYSLDLLYMGGLACSSRAAAAAAAIVHVHHIIYVIYHKAANSVLKLCRDARAQ